MNIGNKDKVLYDNLEVEKQRIRKIENEIKAKPSEKDLRNTVSILKDFGIKIDISDIPDCKSVFDLEQWRLKIIKENL